MLATRIKTLETAVDNITATISDELVDKLAAREQRIMNVRAHLYC